MKNLFDQILNCKNVLGINGFKKQAQPLYFNGGIKNVMCKVFSIYLHIINKYVNRRHVHCTVILHYLNEKYFTVIHIQNSVKFCGHAWVSLRLASGTEVVTNIVPAHEAAAREAAPKQLHKMESYERGSGRHRPGTCTTLPHEKLLPNSCK